MRVLPITGVRPPLVMPRAWQADEDYSDGSEWLSMVPEEQREEVAERLYQASIAGARRKSA